MGRHDDVATAVSGLMALLAGKRGGIASILAGLGLGDPKVTERVVEEVRVEETKRAALQREGITACDPSSDQMLPAGWEDPSNWR